MRQFAWLLILSCAANSLFAAEALTSTAFVDVNVVPMDSERVLQHQTVLVRGNAIEAIGDVARITVPAEARRVEVGGKAWLIPGLADMHTHLASQEESLLHVAYGVTTVLHMGGDNTIFPIQSLRSRLANGIAPQVFFGMMVDGAEPLSGGWPVHSAEEARFAVRVAKERGYDFVKIYNGLSAAEFEAITDEARKSGVPVIGHGVRSVGLPAALFKGQVMVAHAEEFYYTAFGNKPADSRLVDDVAAQTAKSGAYVTASLSTNDAIARQWGKPEVLQQFWSDPLLAYMSPASLLNWWATPRRDYTRNIGNADTTVAFLRAFVKALSDHGVPLLAGTDNPLIPGLVPGYAINEELRTLLESGLTPFQALSAATRTPGEFIAKYVPRAQPFGTVAKGKRADLVLLAANPLQSMDTIKTPLGVMFAGHWKTAQELHAELETNKARSAATLRLISR